jgi:hypothetical protein
VARRDPPPIPGFRQFQKTFTDEKYNSLNKSQRKKKPRLKRLKPYDGNQLVRDPNYPNRTV